MFELLLTVIGVFVLYWVVFPLVGMVSGVVGRVFVPYLLGSGLVFGLLSMLQSTLVGYQLAVVSILIWCVPLLAIRYWHRPRRELSWHQGHYRAAFSLLTCGLLSRSPQAEGAGLARALHARLRTG